MTLNQYLKATGKATDWPYMQPAERNKIADDYIRQANLVQRQPDYTFRMAGERHAEAEGITDTMVQAAVDKAVTCRSHGCENVAFKNGDGLCPWCYEEHEELKAVPKTPPMSHVKWTFIYLACAFGIVIAIAMIGAFFAGVEGR